MSFLAICFVLKLFFCRNISLIKPHLEERLTTGVLEIATIGSTFQFIDRQFMNSVSHIYVLNNLPREIFDISIVNKKSETNNS